MPEIMQIESNDAPEYVAAGWRTVNIMLNTLSFHSATDETFTVAFAYSGANFCIAPPKLPEHTFTAWDRLQPLLELETFASEDLRELNAYPPVTKDEQGLIENLPSGWNCSSLRHYSAYDFAHVERRFHRLATHYHYCPDMYEDEIIVHPTLHRPITNQEYEALIFTTLPDWLAKLQRLFLADHWKAQDWQSRFNAMSGKWVGSNTPGEPCKFFSLTEYVPPSLSRERVRAHEFNHETKIGFF